MMRAPHFAILIERETKETKKQRNKETVMPFAYFKKIK